MRWRHPTILLALLALVALGLRLLYLYQVAASPFFDESVVDARSYVEYGRELAGGAWSGRPLPFWQPPLYPYFLGLLFALFGDGLVLPRLLQALAGAATCVALWDLGRRAFSPAVGWLAAVLAALYGPFIYFEGELLPATWAVLLDVVVLLALLWAARGQSSMRWLAAGLLLGLSALMVANVLLFAPVVILWFALGQQTEDVGAAESRWRRIAAYPHTRHLLIFALGIALVVGPVTLRNRFVSGEWVLISFNVGANFYIGNNADSERTMAARPGEEWLEIVNLPEREAGITSPGAGSDYLLAKGAAYIAAEPLDYLTLLGRKFYLFWRGDEIPRNLDPYFARQYSALLQLLLWKHGLAFPFGLVAPLALLGMVYYLINRSRRNPEATLVLLFAATYMLSVVLFFVSGRHRLPAVPCLLLFAAYGIIQLAQLRQQRLAVGAGALVLLVIAANAGVGAADPGRASFEHYTLGAVYENKGLKVNALKYYRRAVELDPSYERALLGLANMYGTQQRYDEVADTWRQLLNYHPQRLDVHLGLADLFLLKSKYEEAIAEYSAIISREPQRADLHGRLAYAHSMAGQLDLAERAYLKTLELAPDSSLVYYELGKLYEERVEPQRAEWAYGQLLSAQEDHVDGMARLAGLLLGRNNVEEAENYLERALATDPENVQALWNMGTLESERGAYEAAIEHFQNILAHHPEDLRARRALAHMYLKVGDKERADTEYARYERTARQQRMQRQTEEKTQQMMKEVMRQQFGSP